MDQSRMPPRMGGGEEFFLWLREAVAENNFLEPE
jgi:hypothetical protein